MRRFWVYLVTGAVLLATGLAGNAQTTRGTLAGVVTDSTGAVVSGATVTATPMAGGEARTTKTGDSGEYRIEALNPGEYLLAIEASGFAKTELQRVTVRTSLVTSYNVTLGVAKAAETITVEASGDRVQTETGELSKVVPAVAVKDLPYINLNPYSLASTLPGVLTVNSRDDFTNGAAFSVNGLRPRANNFLLDGFDNNDNGIAGQAFQPNNTEAIQEVTVLTNSYAAEFGRGGGSVSNVTFKSGSNSFHGSLWEQYSGSRLNALTSEQGRQGEERVPQFVSNIFGFRFGGPIVKNDLFFFATSQWQRNYGASTFASNLQLPTAAGAATLQALAASNPRAQQLLDWIGDLRGVATPAPILIGDRPGCVNCAVEFGRFQRTDSGASLSREWTARVDFTPTDSDNFLVRYTDNEGSFAPDLFANPAALPYADTQQGGPSRLLGVMWAHTFSPRVINELRFSGQQIDFEFGPTDRALASPFAFQPDISISGINTQFGGFSQRTFPQGRGHKTYQVQDAVTWSSGGHTMRFGADVAVLLIRDAIPFNSDGAITYTAGGTCPATPNPITCTALANFLDDFTGGTGSISKQFGNPRISVPTSQQAYYFQDSWKVKPNLTLDYGLRYEYHPQDANNVLPFPSINRETLAIDPLQTRHEVEEDRNNWGPRFGFAYTPRFWGGLFGEDRTVIRGGFGIFYDAFFTNINNNTAGSSPNTLGGTTIATGGRGLANPFALVAAVTPTVSPINAITSVDSKLKNPQTYQWNVNVQRELPARMIAEVAYVGTRGTRLWVNEQLNERVLGGARVIPSRGSVVIRGNQGDSNYHGLQTMVSRNVGSLTMRGSYTWSRSIDNMSEVFATSGGASRWMNVNDPRSDRGVSAFHRTHRAAISYVYDIPFAKNRGVLTAILGGWSTSGTISFQSGTPETIHIGGWDQNGDGEAFNDRPMIGNPDAAINYTDGCLQSSNPCSGIGFDDGTGNLVDWNTGAPGTLSDFRYIIHDVNSGINGNLGRNSFYFPGRQDWNLTAIKRFNMPFAEGHNLEFRADFFNAFNHPNEGVANLLFSGDINNTDFLNIDVTRSGGRQVILWLKYTF
jgi:hypothetical protein